MPSLQVLSIGELVHNFLNLLNLKNLTEITINSATYLHITIDSEILPALKHLRINYICAGNVTINSSSLEKIQIEGLRGTHIDIMEGSNNLETLILGNKSIENGDEKTTIKITGIYSKLKVLHTRSVSGFKHTFPFLHESLCFKNFPALYLGEFIDKKAGPKADPKAALLTQQLGIIKNSPIWAIIAIKNRYNNQSIEQLSIFSIIPSDIARLIINKMFQEIFHEIEKSSIAQ